MYNILVAIAILAISSYFDVRHRGISPYLIVTFIAAAILVNMVVGGFSIDGMFIISIFFCGMFYLVSVSGIYGKHDAGVLSAITFATPFLGYMIPSILCLVMGLVTAAVYHVLLCQYRNYSSGKNYRYCDVLFAKPERGLVGRLTLMPARRAFSMGIARLFSHVNGGEKFAVPATIPKNGVDYFDLKMSKKKMGVAKSKYVIPVLPMIPFIAIWYFLMVIAYF